MFSRLALVCFTWSKTVPALATCVASELSKVYLGMNSFTSVGPVFVLNIVPACQVWLRLFN